MCPVAPGEIYTFPMTVVRMTFLGINNEEMNAVIICESHLCKGPYLFDFGYSLGTWVSLPLLFNLFLNS